MVVLIFILLYFIVGLLWLYVMRNKLDITNMLQPLFIMVIWPAHLIGWVVGNLIK